MWAFGTVKIIGIKITGGGNTPYVEKNAMVIANHISWLDIPILYTEHSVSFIGRAEMKKWPIISLLIKSGGTIFINRERKRDLIHINQIVSQELMNGSTVGLFPEGKTGNGLVLQQFKPALLESAITAKSTIIPLVIQYYTLDGKPTTKTTYEGDITLWQSLKNSLLLNGIVVKITPLPRIKADDFKSRDILADFLYQQINQHLIGNKT
jgi:1-acyl-sn-glycerol-3-phosphate acyltransferase